MACRARFAQVQLLRLTRSPDGKLVVGPLAPGRGAYVCASAGCLALLTRKRTLGRALRVEISPDAVALLVAELTKRLCV